MSVEETENAYNGQLAGKTGWNLVWFVPSFVRQVCVALGLEAPTPESPEPKINETPRAPINHIQSITHRQEKKVENQVERSLGTHGERSQWGLYSMYKLG